MTEANTTTGQWAQTHEYDTSADSIESELGFKDILVILVFALCVIIVLVNSLTLAAHCRTKALRNIQNKYIISMAGADSLVGRSILELLIVNYATNKEYHVHCQYVLGSLFTAITVSLASMFSVAIDRYLYILHPFVYRRVVTPMKVNVIILVQWIVSAGQGYAAAFILGANDVKLCNPFYAFTTNAVRYYLPVLYFTATIIIGVTYGQIAKAAKLHHEQKDERSRRINEVLAKNEKRTKVLKTPETPHPCQENYSIHFRNESSLDLVGPVASSHTNDDSLLPIKNLVKNDNLALETCNDILSSNFSTTTSTNDKQRRLHNFKSQLTQEAKNKCHQTIECKNKCKNKCKNQLANASSVYVQADESSKEKTMKTIPDNTELKPARARTLRWLKQMVVVFGLFIIFWTPTMTYILSSIFISINYKVTYILAFLGTANSAVNFFVYSFMNQQFRTAMKKIFRCRG